MSDASSPIHAPSPVASVASGPLDRCSIERAEPGLLARLLADPATRVLPLFEGRFPATGEPTRLGYRSPVPADTSLPAFFLGRVDGVASVAVELDDHEFSRLTDGDRVLYQDARTIGPWLERTDLDCLLTSMAVAKWHRTHPRCPRCGRSTRAANAGWTRRCDADGSEHYPRTDPAVIMSVIDSTDRLLLARNESWDAGRRSVLAGFVEPGERLEDAVAREVREEVGVLVTDVTYLDNQPWPFPSSLMLGFTARAADPALTLDDTEIVEAEWYTRQSLGQAVARREVLLPSRMSIARRLVERWFGGQLVSGEEAAMDGGASGRAAGR